MHKIVSFVGSQTYTNLVLTAIAVILAVFVSELGSFVNHPFGNSVPISGEVSISGSKSALGISQPFQVEVSSGSISIDDIYPQPIAVEITH